MESLSSSSTWRSTTANNSSNNILKRTQSKLGRGHAETLRCMIDLANKNLQKGLLDEARQLYTDVLRESQDEILSNNCHSPLTLTAMHNLATIYNELGRWTEAENLLSDCYRLMKSKYGEDDPNVLGCQSSLAATKRHLSKNDEAEGLYKECILLQKKLLESRPDSHNLMANIMNDLASMYRLQKRFTEAEILYRACVQMNEKAYAESHPVSLGSVLNLANIYIDQRAYEKAQPLLSKGLATCRVKLGTQHPITMGYLNNVAKLISLSQPADIELALLLQREALSASSSRLGDSHPFSTTFLRNLEDLESRPMGGGGGLLEKQRASFSSHDIYDKVRHVDDHRQTATSLAPGMPTYERLHDHHHTVSSSSLVPEARASFSLPFEQPPQLDFHIFEPTNISQPTNEEFHLGGVGENTSVAAVVFGASSFGIDLSNAGGMSTSSSSSSSHRATPGNLVDESTQQGADCLAPPAHLDTFHAMIRPDALWQYDAHPVTLTHEPPAGEEILSEPYMLSSYHLAASLVGCPPTVFVQPADLLSANVDQGTGSVEQHAPFYSTQTGTFEQHASFYLTPTSQPPTSSRSGHDADHDAWYSPGSQSSSAPTLSFVDPQLHRQQPQQHHQTDEWGGAVFAMAHQDGAGAHPAPASSSASAATAHQNRSVVAPLALDANPFDAF